MISGFSRRRRFDWYDRGAVNGEADANAKITCVDDAAHAEDASTLQTNLSEESCPPIDEQLRDQQLQMEALGLGD